MAKTCSFPQGQRTVKRLTLSEAVSLRRFLDEGLSGYTYLEREVDASFVAGHGQLKLVPPEAAVAGHSTIPPTGVGT